MQRDLHRLATTAHDLLVVGGGLQGACIAWDAAQRGLRVALIEREDFGAGTSANSLRIVHGGLRYLARGDLPRMRESTRERSALLRIAPGLVEPLPVLVPAAGHGSRSLLALGAALRLNDLLSPDRNRGLDPDRRIPSGRLIDPEECRRLFPGFPQAGSKGGALWYDARLRHPERLALAFARAAADLGAHVANHCGMERAMVDRGAITGAEASDRLGGRRVEISARSVVLATGPWTNELVGAGARVPHAFALNLEVRGRLAEVAVGVRAGTGPGGDPVVGGGRYIFLHPQERTTLLGTWYALPEDRSEAELVALGMDALLHEWRAACPALHHDSGQVVGYQSGWLPLKAGRARGRASALAERPGVVDHGVTGGPQGMFSAEGVKFTTARRVAEGVTDLVLAALDHPVVPCRTADTRVDDREVPMPALDARVRQAVRDEMAATLADVLRRLHPGGRPGAPGELELIAAVAGAELGWGDQRKEAEIEAVKRSDDTRGFVPEPLA